MNLRRIAYRTRQFWNALAAVPGADELARAMVLLSPGLRALFERMQPSEQAHSLKVFCRLLEEADGLNLPPDLLAAALLHDVGKSLSPLSPWERAWIVLGQALFPQAARRWGQPGRAEVPNGQRPAGWRRPFVVAACHPDWGAELAARAGASALTVSLIRRHQELLPLEGQTEEEELLRRLQAADDRD